MSARFVKRLVSGLATLAMGTGVALAAGPTHAPAATTKTDAMPSVRTTCVGREVVRCAVLKVNAANRSVYAYGSVRNAASHRGLYTWVRTVRVWYYQGGWKYFTYNTPQRFSTGSQVAYKALTAYGTKVTRPFRAQALLQYAYKGKWHLTWVTTSSVNLTP